MDTAVPTSQQWVWFSTALKQSVPIEWTENNEAKSAFYYVQKCYWGFLLDPKSEIARYTDWPFHSDTPIKGELDAGDPGSQRAPPQVRTDAKIEIKGW